MATVGRVKWTSGPQGIAGHLCLQQPQLSQQDPKRSCKHMLSKVYDSWHEVRKMQRPGWKNIENYFPVPQNSEIVKLLVPYWGDIKMVFKGFFLDQNHELDALKLLETEEGAGISDQ